MSDEYVRVAGVVTEIRRDAVLFSVGKSVRRGAWIPRSQIHVADNATVSSLRPGAQASLRIRKWKAEEVGFAGDHDAGAADRDLFREGSGI